MKSIMLCCLLIPAIAQGTDPEMLWADASNGRPFSKDPSVIRFGEVYLLYYSLPAETGWTLGIARSTNLVHWEKVGVVLPGAGCEQRGIAAPAAWLRQGRVHLFYAGGYNNEPQQIGVASSEDGIHWKRVSDQPLVPNGPPGSWNSSESGHPGVFVDADGTTHLFYQGNNDGGQSWYLSKLRIEWKAGRPVVVK